MSNEIKELIKEIKEYRDSLVVHNYPHQQISDIITKWEMKQLKTFHPRAIDGYSE
tara:strand:- start:372 stop:536 length:165 start_codon:yes stop_codon:yes gene_type:complete